MRNAPGGRQITFPTGPPLKTPQPTLDRCYSWASALTPWLLFEIRASELYINFRWPSVAGRLASGLRYSVGNSLGMFGEMSERASSEVDL